MLSPGSTRSDGTSPLVRGRLSGLFMCVHPVGGLLASGCSKRPRISPRYIGPGAGQTHLAPTRPLRTLRAALITPPRQQGRADSVAATPRPPANLGAVALPPRHREADGPTRPARHAYRKAEATAARTEATKRVLPRLSTRGRALAVVTAAPIRERVAVRPAQHGRNGDPPSWWSGTSSELSRLCRQQSGSASTDALLLGDQAVTSESTGRLLLEAQSGHGSRPSGRWRPPPEPHAVTLPTHPRGSASLKRSPATGDDEDPRTYASSPLRSSDAAPARDQSSRARRRTPTVATGR